MQKINNNRNNMLKYTFVVRGISILEVFVIIFTLLESRVLFLNENGIFSALQIISNHITAVFPFASCWLFMIKGSVCDSIILIGLGILIFLYRVFNIFFLIKRKKFAFISSGVMWGTDLVCILIAFFTTTKGPDSQSFGLEIAFVLGTLIINIIMFILLRELYKKEKNKIANDSTMCNTGDGSLR